MAKRRSMGMKQRAHTWWKGLSESDRRFYMGLFILTEAVGDKKLRYPKLPTPLHGSLLELDRNTLYSVMAECLFLLVDAPVSERVKWANREREAKKKKRISAPKKKSRTKKKPAPTRRKRKGPSK